MAYRQGQGWEGVWTMKKREGGKEDDEEGRIGREIQGEETRRGRIENNMGHGVERENVGGKCYRK